MNINNDLLATALYYIRHYWRQIVASLAVFLIVGIVLTLMEKTYELYISRAKFIPYETRKESQSILPYLYMGRKEIPPEQKLLAMIASRKVIREFVDSTGYRFYIEEKSPPKMKILSIDVKEIPPQETLTVRVNRDNPYVEIRADREGDVKLIFLTPQQAAERFYRKLHIRVMNIQEMLGISRNVESPMVAEENLKVVIFQLSESDPYIKNIVEEFSRFILRYNIRDKTLKYQNSKRFISRQINNYMEELDKINYQIRIFRLRNAYVEIDRKSPAWAELLELERQKIEIETEINFLRRWLDQEEGLEYIITSDRLLEERLKMLYGLQDSLNLMEVLYGKESPQYRIMEGRFRRLRESLRNMVKERLKNMDSRLQFIKLKEKNLKNMIGRSMENEKEALTLQARKKAIEDILTLLSQRLEEIRIEEAEVVPDFKIMEVDMDRVIRGRHWKRNLLASLLFALLFAISYILIVEYTSNTVRDPDEVAIKLNIPKEKLYEIPYIEDEDEMPINILLKGLRNKLIQGSAALEAFRIIALREIINRNIRKTGATSSIQGEGKTFFLINLAAVLAMMNKRVVIVDGDMRKKNISEIFNVKDSDGLSNIIEGVDFPSIIHPVRETLHIVAAGKRFIDPIAIFSSPRYDDFMEFLEKEYDYIFVDIPPVLNVAETTLTVEKLGKVFFIIRASFTQVEAIERALSMLEEEDIIAHILNSVGFTRTGYYRYYRYYRNYYYNRSS